MFGEHTYSSPHPPYGEIRIIAAHKLQQRERNNRKNKRRHAQQHGSRRRARLHYCTTCILIMFVFVVCSLPPADVSPAPRRGGGGGFRNSQIRHGISPYGVHTTRSRSVAAREIRIRNARLQFNGPESADRFIGPCHRISHDSQTIFQSSRLTVDRNRNTPVPSRPELDFGVRLGLVILYL